MQLRWNSFEEFLEIIFPFGVGNIIRIWRHKLISRKPLMANAIGLQGFEPWTSPTRTARSTKLSHNPNKSSWEKMGSLLCHFRDEVQAHIKWTRAAQKS